MKVSIKNLKNLKILIATSLIAVVAVPSALAIKAKYDREHYVIDNIVNEPVVEDIVGIPGKPSISPSVVDGYTTYIVKYSDTEGKAIDMVSTINIIKNEDKVYMDLEQAKEDGIIKEHIDVDSLYYVQIKAGTTFAWTITPKDTSTIESWTDDKAGILLALNPTAETNNTIETETVILDYSQEQVQPTFHTSSK